MSLVDKNIEQLFGNLGFTLERSVTKKKVLELIEKIKPQRTNLDLVRLGPQGDGGYIVPNDLNGIEACFSPGVDLISEFEMACHQLGMKIFMADKSVENPKIDLPKDQYSFIKKFVGCYNDEEIITLDHWLTMANLSQGGDLLLQMDIEGSEYNTIINASEDYLRRCRIIVIEIHDMHKIWNKSFHSISRIFFTKLLKHHTVVHVHPNNCCGEINIKGVRIPRVMEFTFLRNDRFTLEAGNVEIPHHLDADNTSNSTLTLSNDWL